MQMETPTMCCITPPPISLLSGTSLGLHIWAALGAQRLQSGYGLHGVADFNRDGHPDFALYNPYTRRTAIWYLNGNSFVSGAYGPIVTPSWTVVAP